MKRKIYVVGWGYSYINWMEGEPCVSMEKSDLVVFTGGEDVWPWLYNRKTHTSTSCNPERDRREINEFQKALRLGKPMVGICRGSQFLCVMAGGILVQHQSHPGIHDIFTACGKNVTVTSTHHQRQYPWDIDEFNLIGWCYLSPYSWGEDGEDLSINTIDVGSEAEGIQGNLPEVEIAIYPKIKALAIQSHPEMQDLNGPSIAYFRDLLTRFIEGRDPV